MRPPCFWRIQLSTVTSHVKNRARNFSLAVFILVVLLPPGVKAQEAPTLAPALLSGARQVAPAPANSNILSSGTGFFVSAGGLVITANHVVSHCREISIASNTVKGVQADLVASNSKVDLAELIAKTSGQMPFLSFSAPGSDIKLTTLGYPLGSSITKATVVQASMIAPSAPSHPMSSRIAVLLTGASVTEGFSGGPIAETSTGHVIGVLHGGFEASKAQQRFGIDRSDVRIGDGEVMLAIFYSRLPPYLRPPQVTSNSYSQDALVRATVHVFCWR
jgi:S1-C subfamily serine protease